MRRIILSLFVSLLALAGCSVNPVTGQRQLNFFSEDWELNVSQQYAPLRQSQGGDYKLDPALTSYVQSVGNKLAAQATRQLPYEFHVLNSSVPNAWALPGGKIVINRGLLTELNSEAELAAVLGHEIVHADAAHGARMQSKGLGIQLGAMVAAIYGSSKAETRTGQQVAMLIPQIGAQLVASKYGRDAERESDHYGMQYMSEAGYDPQGAVELQETFVKLSEGRRQDFVSNLFASHPPSQERVENNKEVAATLPDGGKRGEKIYQQKTAYIRKKAPAYEKWAESRQALADGDDKKARALLNEAFEIEPREALFYTHSGDIFASKKNYNRAITAYTKALDRDDGFFYHFLRRGQARHELGRKSAAKADLKRSIELLPTSEANYLLGSMEKEAGNAQLATNYFSAASQSNSASGQLARQELVTMELAGNPGKYIKTQPVLSQNGTVGAAIANQAPIAVNGIVLRVRFVDNRGQVREFTHQVRDVLQPGNQTAVSIGLRGIASAEELNQRVALEVVAAKPAN